VSIRDAFLAMDKALGLLLFDEFETISTILARESGKTVPEVHAAMLAVALGNTQNKGAQGQLRAAFRVSRRASRRRLKDVLAFSPPFSLSRVVQRFTPRFPT